MGKVGTPDSVDVLRRILRTRRIRVRTSAPSRTFEKSKRRFEIDILAAVLPFPQGWQLRYCRQIRRAPVAAFSNMMRFHGRARRLPVHQGLAGAFHIPACGNGTEQGVLQYASAEAVP